MVDDELLAVVARLEAMLAARDAEILRLRAAVDRHAVTVQSMERRADEQSRVAE